MPYTDSYSKNPAFNFQAYADGLVEVACKATEDKHSSSFTVGIFGSWGDGKTTLMRNIEKCFNERSSDEEKNYKTLWFNAWKYDKKESIWGAFIQSMLIEIINEGTLSEELKRTAENILLSTLDLTIDLSKKIILSYIKDKTGMEIDNIKNDDFLELKGESYINFNELTKYYESINKFEQDFKKLLSHHVGENGKLIVFIDDLDRCLPENSISILESLKLYFDISNCIFFIGIDRRTIEQAVLYRYSNYKDVSFSGKEYLEKMIQLNFFLPQKTQADIGTYLRNEYSRIATSIDDSDTLNDLWTPIFIATQNNIRKIKQFLIAWYLIKNLNENINGDEKQLALLLLIQMFFTSSYDLLVKDETFRNALKRACEDQGVAIRLSTDYGEYSKIFEKDRKIIDLLTSLKITSMELLSNKQTLDTALETLSRTGTGTGTGR
ncbi:MAG: KAP family P-loop NTPase fold protein [Bacteroidia bacterium]